MTLLPRGHTAVADLLAKGVVIPNPGSLDVDDDVDIDRISGDAVVLHPGTCSTPEPDSAARRP